MSDSTYVANPTRIYFTVDQDEEWKKVTVESFIKSTADDITAEDDLDNILADPEGLSVRRIINDWFGDNPAQHNSRQCELCIESKSQLKLGLLHATAKRIDYKSFDVQ